jgi:hypothetical protein
MSKEIKEWQTIEEQTEEVQRAINKLLKHD